MKIYELIVLFFNDFQKKKEFVSCLKNALICNNFIFLNFENWGKLNLCYKIKKKKKAFFLYFKFLINNDFLSKLDIFLKKNTFIIRYLFLLSKFNNYSISHICLKNKNVYKKK